MSGILAMFNVIAHLTVPMALLNDAQMAWIPGWLSSCLQLSLTDSPHCLQLQIFWHYPLSLWLFSCTFMHCHYILIGFQTFYWNLVDTLRTVQEVVTAWWIDISHSIAWKISISWIMPRSDTRLRCNKLPWTMITFISE